MPSSPASTARDERKRTKEPIDKPRLSVRIHITTDARLTVTCKETGLGPSGVFEEAINSYCDFLGIPADFPDAPASERPFRPRTQKKRTRGRPEDNDQILVSVRIHPTTDLRFTQACLAMGQGPQDVIETALNAWMHRQGIPQNPNMKG